jgi:hypothetical protein
LGVSLREVVAIIERPASQMVMERLETGKSNVLLPGRLPKNNVGMKQISIVKRMMAQSMGSNFMV